jgi:hypothetical protein
LARNIGDGREILVEGLLDVGPELSRSVEFHATMTADPLTRCRARP